MATTTLGNPSVTQQASTAQPKNLATTANQRITTNLAQQPTVSPTKPWTGDSSVPTYDQGQLVRSTGAAPAATTSTATRPSNITQTGTTATQTNTNTFPAEQGLYDLATKSWFVKVGNLYYPVEYQANNTWKAIGVGSGIPLKPANAQPTGTFANPSAPSNANLTSGGTVGNPNPMQNVPPGNQASTTPPFMTNGQQFAAERGVYDNLTHYWYVQSGGQWIPVEYDGSTNSWRQTGLGYANPVRAQNGTAPGSYSNPNPPSTANTVVRNSQGAATGVQSGGGQEGGATAVGTGTAVTHPVNPNQGTYVPPYTVNGRRFDATQGLYDPASKYWYVYQNGQFWPVEYDGPSNSWQQTGMPTAQPTKPQNASPQGYFSNPNPPSNAPLVTSIQQQQTPTTTTPTTTTPTTTTPTTTTPTTTTPTTTEPTTTTPTTTTPVDPYANLPKPIGLSGPPPSLF
jgi:hypothetical protein